MVSPVHGGMSEGQRGNPTNPENQHLRVHVILNVAKRSEESLLAVTAQCL